MKLFFYTVLLILITQTSLSQELLVNGVSTSNPGVISEEKILCDTVYSFPTNSSPSGLTFVNDYLYYVDTMYIYKTDIIGNHVDSILNPAIADNAQYISGDLAYDGNHLWYANENLALLYKIDLSTGTSIASYQLPDAGQPDPNGWSLAWDGQDLWHSIYYPSTSTMLFRLSNIDGQVLSSVVASDGFVEIEWINGELYGFKPVGASSDLFKIDATTGATIETFQWCIDYPLGLAVNVNTIWNASGLIPNGNERIYQIGELSSIFELDGTNQKELVKICDVLGRNTIDQSNTVLIYIYSDGTSKKVYRME